MTGEPQSTGRRALRRVRRLAARAGLVQAAGAEALLLEVDRLERRLQALRDGLRERGSSPSPVAERTIPLDYGAGSLRIVASAYRRQATAAKEPFTVRWIETTVAAGGVLYDIGANVGGYSLVAAAQGPQVSVVAFEPSYRNYAALCDNIVVNRFDARITPLPLALGRETRLARFRHRRLITGGGQHDSRTEGEAAGWTPEYEQPMPLFALDDAVRLLGLPVPTHVKLDVDGAELEVLQGAAATLRSPALTSLLVEMPDDGAGIVALLEESGFALRDRHRTPAVWYGIFGRIGAREQAA